MTARDLARQAQEIFLAGVLELDLDWCQNSYGVAPCTAAGSVGSECYHTFGTCQDKANYARGTKTRRFITRGTKLPAGELLRPYLLDAIGAPTIADPEQGLARRAVLTLDLADEPDSDIDEDPYVATRRISAGDIAYNISAVPEPTRLITGSITAPKITAISDTDIVLFDAANTHDKLQMYRLNSSSWDLLSELSLLADYAALAKMGDAAFVVCSSLTTEGNHKLRRYVINPDNTLTLVGTTTIQSATLTTCSVAGLSENLVLWCRMDSAYAKILQMYQWTGSSFVTVGDPLIITGDATRVSMAVLDTTTVVAAVPVGTVLYLRAYRWNSSTSSLAQIGLSQAIGTVTVNNGATVTAISPSMVVVADVASATIRAYQFDGQDFTQITDPISVGTANAGCLASLAPEHIAYIDGSSDTLRLYSFNAVVTRMSAPPGTFWTRLLARNKHAVGRFARYRRGYVTAPWSWETFQDELYIIETIKGPANGKVQVVLKDPIKLVDRKKTPTPTDGKLTVELPAYDEYGAAQGGSGSTIQLRSDASAADDAYIGMAVNIIDQTGAGQERVIIAYVGATRTATISPDWAVAPDNTSIYMVQKLQIALPTGKGAQYDEYGYPTWVRIGEETIRIAGRTDDVLYWETTADRAQFDTALEDHKADDQVQICKVFQSASYTDVIKWFFNDAGLSDDYINTTNLADLDATWLGADYLITRCLSAPRENTAYVKELVKLCSGALWWDPVGQWVDMLLMVPDPPGEVPAEWSNDNAIIENSLQVETLDDQRITGSATYYRLLSATADESKHVNYLRGTGISDADASSENEYGDQRIEIIYAAWFGSANGQAAADLSSRRVDQLRDAPKRVRLAVHPKDYDFQLGEQRDILAAEISDVTGTPKRTRILITRITDKGARVEVEGRSTIFARRYGFIAPNGTADYPSDTDYAHVSENSGLMSDGEDGYLII